LTILSTFLSAILKHASTLETLERAIPWDELATFFTTIPQKVMTAQGLLILGKSQGTTAERWVMLTSGCAPPLLEDWCLLGMERVG
jgi:hypothetical protein